MSLQAAIVAIAAANAPLTALVSTRVYEYGLPQNKTVPAMTFQIISQPNFKAMGPTIVDYHPRVQFDGWVQSARSGGAVPKQTLRDAIFNAYFGYLGTIGGVTIKAFLLEEERPNIEGLDTDKELDRVNMDFMVDFI